MGKYIQINTERTDIIKNISDLASKLEDLPMTLNDNQAKNDEEKKDKEIDKKNSEILKKLHEKSVPYTSKLKEEVETPLKVNKILFSFQNFETEVKSIKEIFKRKDVFIQEHENLKNNPKKDKTTIDEVESQKEVKESLNSQIKDEIENFKNNKESELLNILKKFIDIKHNATKEVIFAFIFKFESVFKF